MKKTSKAEFEAIADFVWRKNDWLNSKFIPSIHGA